MKFEKKLIRFKGKTVVEDLFSYDSEDGLYHFIPRPFRWFTLWFKKVFMGKHWDEIFMDSTPFHKYDLESGELLVEGIEVNFDVIERKVMHETINADIITNNHILEVEKNAFWMQSVAKSSMLKNLNLFELFEQSQRRGAEQAKKLSMFSGKPKDGKK